MPGSAVTSPATTRLSEGSAVTRRSTRKMRSARSTEKDPVAGTRAIPTTSRSNRLHGSRKKARPNTNMRAASSTAKIASTAWSIA